MASLDYPEPPPPIRRRNGRLDRLRRQRGVDQLADGPDVIRDLEGHGRRGLMGSIGRQALVGPAQIVVRDVEIDRGAMVLKSLAEPVGKRVMVRAADGIERELVLLRTSGEVVYVCTAAQFPAAVDNPDLAVGFPAKGVRAVEAAN